MTVETELATLVATKSALRDAIEAGNVTVGTAPFSHYPDKIKQVGPPTAHVLVRYSNNDVYYSTAGYTMGSAPLGELVATGVVGIIASPDKTYALMTGPGSAPPRRFTVSMGVVDTLSALPNVTAGGGMDISPDGSVFVVQRGNSPFIGAYNTTDWSPVSGFSPTGSPRVVKFSPDGTKLALGIGNTLTMVDTATWASFAVAGVNESVDSIAWSSDSKRLAFHALGGTVIRQYDVENDVMLLDSSGTQGVGTPVYISRDKYILILASTAPTIRRMPVRPEGGGPVTTGQSLVGLSLLVGAPTGRVCYDTAGNFLFCSQGNAAQSPRGYRVNADTGLVEGLISTVQGSGTPYPTHIIPMY